MGVGTAIARIVSEFELRKVCLTPPQGIRSGRVYKTSRSLQLLTEEVCFHFALVLSLWQRL